MPANLQATRILVLFAHPALQRSRVNRVLIEAAKGLDDVTIQDLYEAYPDFDVDVRHEQALLTTHDLVVFHHPFYWYSVPALLKEWQDLVVEHGWAYGRRGDALRGKRLLSVVTAGGKEEAYRREGYNRYTMIELLARFDQMAHLCGMEYLPPFVVHGTHVLDEAGIHAHAADYRRCLVALRDGHLDVAAARAYPRLNTDLDAVIRSEPGREETPPEAD